MWPLGGIIAAIAVGFVIVTSLGILLAISFERRRHNKILRAHGLTQGLSKYDRSKLSGNELNCSHGTAPATQLRRSIQMPYGIVSVGRDGNPCGDEEKQLDPTDEHPDDYLEVLRPKNNRRIRRSFSGQPLYIPKTRRPGKVKKAVLPEMLPKSPLSAITEFSDPPTSAPPESSGFPAHPTTMLLPETTVTRPEKYVPAQWPLVIANTRGSAVIPTEVTEIAARESVLVRRGGGMPHFTALFRSASAHSMTSLAPNDPLPPLPTIDTPRRAKSHDARRTSAASLDTIGSSVLGTLISSPMNNGTESNHFSVLTPRAPNFDLALKRELATPELQAPPAKQTIHGLVTGKSIRSLHPCVDFDDPSPAKCHLDPWQVPTIVIREESLKTIDASTWVLPPLKVPKLRRQLPQPHRHSMIEPSKLAQYRAVSDPTRSLAEGEVFAAGKALKRPNSVAAGSSIQWDCQPSLFAKRQSWNSLDGTRRGHKRQNCIRITNLPVPDLNSGIRRLPEVREEHSSSTSSIAPERGSKTFQVRQPRPLFISRPPAMDSKSSPTPSPFKNAPILTPTPRPARMQYIQPPGNGPSSLRRSSGTPRPDSEVFNSIRLDEPTSSPYKATPRHWPLSPTMQMGVNDTPPSARPSERFESPILPSPALNSSFLYPRKSLVKGPRGPRNSAQSQSANNSPLQNKQGHSYRVTKDRDSNAQNEVALKKSGMKLRSMNLEGTLLDDTATSSYSQESSPMPSPPLNKRIMGLRTSSCGPPVCSIASSPTLERQMSRGSSPLANPTTSHTNAPNRVDSRVNSSIGAKTSSTSALYLPTPHLSISSSTRVPSMMSTSGGSIWEDASVRADSPEPEEDENTAPLALRTLGTISPNQRHLDPSGSSPRLRQQSQQFSSPTIIERDFGVELDGDAENANASLVVQNLERVVSSGQWSRKTHHRTFTIDAGSYSDHFGKTLTDDTLTPRTRREMDIFGGPGVSRSRKEAGVGLGLKLKMDELIVGTSYLDR